MKKYIGFGENVEGYSIPVLNEREIRAAAGILFLVMLFSIQAAGGSGNFTPLKYAVTFFLLDMVVRVFINPKYGVATIKRTGREVMLHFFQLITQIEPGINIQEMNVSSPGCKKSRYNCNSHDLI